MRFATAVLVAGAVQVVPYLRVADWSGVSGVLVALYLFLAALGAGFFAGRNAGLAGAASVLVGAALAGVLRGLSGPDAASTPGDFLLGELRLMAVITPYALGGAVFAIVGSGLRAWSMRRR